MKKNWKNSQQSTVNSQRLWSVVLGLWTLAVTILTMTACSSDKHAEHADTYTCPMHPTVVSDRPGTCPVCGMDLVRKARPGEEVKVTEELARLIKSPNESVVASVKIIKGEFKSMPVSVKAQGIVTYDTRSIYTIPARIGGRLEKVFLKYSFQPVRKGQKVAEIYSPELITAQRELLYLIENDSRNSALIESAKSKLQLLGATQSQIDDVIRSKEASFTFSIYSAYDGYVIREDQEAPAVTTTSSSSSSSGMDGGMGASGASSTPKSTAMNASGSELIREGNYVSTGQTLFKVVNTSALRIELDLPVAQAGRVAMNDDVELDLGNQMMVQAKVDFVQPFFTEGEEFVKVRLYVKNAGELKIGQLVSATIQMKPVESLWVPREAVLDLGLEKIVFTKERDAFKPVNVKVGIRTDGWVEIIQGISSSDEIASNAQYLVDSESFIKTK
jgi:Cu(I)/Ag(I) efflux system membrane fusion protein